MSAKRSAPAFTIFAGFGSSDVTWTLMPWSSWCPPSSSVDSTTVTLFYTGYLNLPSAFCRTPLHGSHLVCHCATMSPCPSGAEGAALTASRSSYSVQGRAFDVYGTRQSLSCVSKWIRSTSQQQPSMSTSSLCQQPRLHCSMDKNWVWRPSLLCCRSDSMEQSAWVCQISRDVF